MGAAIDLQQTGYRPCMFLYMLDEMFHFFKHLKEDDFDAQCIVMWEILHVTQHHCTEWHGVRRLKDEP